MLGPRRRAFAGSFFLLSLASAFIACAAPNGDDGAASESDVVGGTITSRPEVVVVADADDNFACTGVLVRPDVVLLSEGCRSKPSAIYIGFAASIPVARAPKLGSVAGNATRIPIASWGPLTWASTRLHLAVLATPAAASWSFAAADPAVGDRCEVIGHGPETLSRADGGDTSRGWQRTGEVEITRVAAGVIDTRGVTGSVAVGDYDVFLVCGQKVAGAKLRTISEAPNAIHNEVSFHAVVNPDAARELDRFVGSHGDAGVDAGPPPEPGTPCSTIDEIRSRACGACGTQTTLCVVGAGGVGTWSEYSFCTQEVGGCIPGAVQQTSAGCANPAQKRSRVCDAFCSWGPYSTTCM